MSQTNLNRVRDDLETVKQAAGIGLPFRPEEISFNWALGAAGLFAITWGLLPHGLDHAWGLLPGLVFLAIQVVRVERKGESSIRSSAGPRRARDYAAMGVIALCLLAFSKWAGHLNAPRGLILGAGFFAIGVWLTVWGISRDGGRYSIAQGIPVMAFGLLIPLVNVSLVVLYGVAVAIGCPMAAVMQSRQLRAWEESRAAD